MKRALLVSLIGFAATACAYRPTPTELIHIVDSPSDVRVCTRLGEVSPVVPTTPGFGYANQVMLEETVALGGTHLYLQQRSADWSFVRGIAYRCGPGVRQETIIRTKG